MKTGLKRLADLVDFALDGLKARNCLLQQQAASSPSGQLARPDTVTGDSSRALELCLSITRTDRAGWEAHSCKCEGDGNGCAKHAYSRRGGDPSGLSWIEASD